MKINYHNAEFVTSWFGKKNKLALEKRPEIVFVGSSKVGKSSMINKILNRKALAKTSSKPGKTISINFFDIDKKIFLVDLPGYGFADRSKEQRRDWGSLIDEYFLLDRDIRMIFMLVDIRHEPTENDKLMYEYLMSKQTLFAVAATKADKLSKKQAAEQTERFSSLFGVSVIPFSSETGEGVDAVRQIIEDVTENEETAEEETDC